MFRLYGALHAKTVLQIKRLSLKLSSYDIFQLITFSRTLEMNSEPHDPHQLAPPLKQETSI